MRRVGSCSEGPVPLNPYEFSGVAPTTNVDHFVSNLPINISRATFR